MADLSPDRAAVWQNEKRPLFFKKRDPVGCGGQVNHKGEGMGARVV